MIAQGDAELAMIWLLGSICKLVCHLIALDPSVRFDLDHGSAQVQLRAVKDQLGNLCEKNSMW